MERVALQLLMIEEDQDFGSWLSDRLTKSGFVTRAAGSVEQALRSGLTAKAAAVLVNLGRNGWSSAHYIRTLRDAGLSQPLIVLSSQCQWQDRVDCLDAGADDYLIKPVRAEEVAARLRAIIRRTAGSTSDCLSIGEITLDLKARMAWLKGRCLELTRNEFRMLRLFMLHPDRIMTHGELRDRLYAEPSERSLNAIEVNIARLRHKIGKHRIRTVRGIGYSFDGTRMTATMAHSSELPACMVNTPEISHWFPEI